MDALALIQYLEEQIEKERTELQIKEKLLNDLKSKVSPTKDIQNAATPHHPKPQASGTINIHDLIEEVPKKKSIIEEIGEIVERFGDQEFTIQHVDAVFKTNHGLQASDTSNRNKISTALTKLKDRGLIEITFKGGGNVPNRYKRASQENQEEKKEENDVEKYFT